MANRVEGPTRTITASEAMVAGRSVTFSTTADTCGYTPVGGRSDGILERDVASGDEATIRLRTAEGTDKVMVVAATSVGDKLYAAASGKASPTPVGKPQWIALSAATGDGAIIEAVRIPSDTGPSMKIVEAHTASDALTLAESGSVHTNTGAGGAITLTLPPAVLGAEFFFQVGAAQNLIIEGDAAETISLPSNGVAQANITANAVGETVHLVCCIAGTWGVMGYTGTWT